MILSIKGVRLSLDYIKNKTKKIAITGISGFIGRSLVEAFEKLDFEVIGFDRQGLPTHTECVTPFFSDLSSVGKLVEDLQGVEVVIHLAWEDTFFLTSKTSVETSANNLRALKNLIRAAEICQIKRFVFPSFLGIKKSSLDSTAVVKYQAEKVILNSKIEEKIILRCPLVYDLTERTHPFSKNFNELLLSFNTPQSLTSSS